MRTRLTFPAGGFAPIRPLTLVLLTGLLVQGCSSGSGPDPKWGVSSSPRVAGSGQRIAKGGGFYKLGKPYMIGGRWYTPREQPGYDATGVASWYGDDFHGRKTANGEIYDMNALTAAHPTLPLPTYAYVTNLNNGRTVLVRVNDRGPYVDNRIIDLSRASAKALGISGLGRVRVRYAGHAPLDGNDARERRYLAQQPWMGGPGGAAVASSAPPEPVLMRAPLRQTAAPTSDGWSVMGHRSGGQRSGLGGPQP